MYISLFYEELFVGFYFLFMVVIDPFYCYIVTLLIWEVCGAIV